MKKLAKIVIIMLFIVPMFFSCESLTGELAEIKTNSDPLVLDGGGEDGGDDLPDEPKGAN